MTICTSAFKTGLKPDPRLNLVEWADEYLYLPRESTAEYGKYRSSRTPFVVEPLLELSPTSPTRKVVLMKPGQTAGTTIAIIFLFGTADLYPGPTLMIMPTDTLAQGFSKKKITPTLRDTPRMAGKIKDAKLKTSSNTILEKMFPGGSWRFSGSNSPVIYRQESVRYLILDDFDGFDLDIGDEGDPGDLADRRTATFANSKTFINSTPTIKSLSNVEREYNASSMGKFCCPCPKCGEPQYLIFQNLKFDKLNLSWIYYECAFCQHKIDEVDKRTMLPDGKYIHEDPENEVRGFQYSAMVTPLGWKNTWKKIAGDFLACKIQGVINVEKLKTWTNTLIADPFEQKGERPYHESLKNRAALPQSEMLIPQGALFLTASVDVQHLFLAVLIQAWGRGEECWTISYDRIHGDTSREEVWSKLDEVTIKRQFEHESGAKLHILSMGVDSGDGARTQAVYNYCRKRQPIVFALKGQSNPGKPVLGMPTAQDVNYGGKKIKGGIQLWPIGSDTATLTVYTRLQQEKEGPGYYHFPAGLDDEFYLQLTAEKFVTNRNKKGFPVRELVRVHPRAEVLDCFKYAYAAALRILDSINLDQLERDLAKQLDSKTKRPEEKEKKSTFIPDRKGGWFN